MSLVIHLKSCLIQVSSFRCTTLINNNKLSLYISKHTAALPSNLLCGNKPQNTKLRLLVAFEEKINLYRTFTFTLNWFSVQVRYLFLQHMCTRFPAAAGLSPSETYFPPPGLHIGFLIFPSTSLQPEPEGSNSLLQTYIRIFPVYLVVCRSRSFYPKWL